MTFFGTTIGPLRRRAFQTAVLLVLLLLAGLPDGRCGEVRGETSWHIEAERWPAAEAIFRSDPRWLGGDGASSVDLGGNRVLWLFGDSFVAPAGISDRKSSALVRNSIAVQTGYDPALASMAFAWKTEPGGPVAFFHKKGETWYWPSSGIMLGRSLLVFLMEIRPAENALGFESCGWKAAWVSNPGDPPDRWRMTWLISPQYRELVAGVGSPILENGFLQTFAADGSDRTIYLVRWPEAAARAGTLTAPQWWTGAVSGWAGGEDDTRPPRPVFTDGQMEFTVVRKPPAGDFFRVQTASFLNPCLAASTAPCLFGPWTTAICFFSPPEQGNPELLIYAGKFHPMLRGADMVFSYVINTTSADRLFSDMTIYFPVMLKGRIVKQSAPGGCKH
ncbi:MAG: hypothetical protein AB1724_00620 [Thermodesulfobacteriota bacterium]